MLSLLQLSGSCLNSALVKLCFFRPVRNMIRVVEEVSITLFEILLNALI